MCASLQSDKQIVGGGVVSSEDSIDKQIVGGGLVSSIDSIACTAVLL